MKNLLAIALVILTLTPATFLAAKELDGEEDGVKFFYYTVKKNETVEKRFPGTWINIVRFNRIDRIHIYPGMRIRVPVGLENEFTPLSLSIEEERQSPKFILINLSLQFLGAYEYGELRFSCPISSGKKGFPTPTGIFYISSFEKQHNSTRYFINNTTIPYPMTWALQLAKENGSNTCIFIHGRDLEGEPVSHGCIGLYDEEMQKRYYGMPRDPILTDAKKLYFWVVPDITKKAGILKNPRVKVKIVGF